MADAAPSRAERRPSGASRRRLASNSAWRAEADPVIARIETLAGEKLDLGELADALAVAGESFPRPDLLLAAGPHLVVVLMRVPPDAMLPDAREVVWVRWRTAETAYFLVVGPSGKALALAALAPSLKGRAIPLPAWLPDSPKGALDAARRRIDHDAAEIRALEAELSALSAKHRLDAALGDFVLFEWLRDNASLLAGDGRLVFITGWTSADGEEQLQRDLERLGATCLVRLPPAPPGSTPPLMLRNPGWVRPFEIFALMVGMPNRHEADPSVFLAVVTPLLFGFMFGDIGQGLVLTIAGVILGRRMPVLRLLVPGGVVAMIFGALFGSVFGFEAVPALWVRPLDEPVTLLAVTLGGGAVLMTLGLVISAIEARWRGESVRWWLHEAGLAAAYLSIVVAFFCRQALWGAPVGAAWFVLGAAALDPARPLAASGTALAELVEKLMQLLVNTISFARVGAFALAHAGLSAAVVGLAHAAGGFSFVPIAIAGNVLILGMEGLVVGIQTTRLVLFEFFIRFLQGGGRPLKPLTPPCEWRPILCETMQTEET